MEIIKQLSELVPLVMTIVSVLIVTVEWIYLACTQQVERNKEGWVNIYSAALTYLPIMAVNTLITIVLMFVVYEFRIYTFSFAWYTWILAYIGYDFMSFILHLASHKIRLLWCIHSVHHSPKEIKASVSFRGSFAEFLLAPHLILWLPLLGFHPLQILIVEGIGQLYGVPLHVSKKLFQKRKWLNKFIVTPSFHHLHHAKNDLYIDTNYALTFPIWDKLFNTYQDEKSDIQSEYGVSTDVDSENLYMAQTDEFKILWKDIKNAPKLMDKIKYMLMPPGWSHNNISLTADMIRKKAITKYASK